MDKTISPKRTKPGNLYYPISKLHTKLQESRPWGYIDQWNRFKIPQINPFIYGQLMFDPVAKKMQGGKV